MGKVSSLFLTRSHGRGVPSVSCFLQGEGLASQSCACLKQSDDCAGGGEEREQRAGADSAAPPAIAEHHSAFSAAGHRLPLCPGQLCGPAGRTDTGRVSRAPGPPALAQAAAGAVPCPRGSAGPSCRPGWGPGPCPRPARSPRSRQVAGQPRASPRPSPVRPGPLRSLPGGEKPLCSPARHSTAPAPSSQSGGGEGAPAPGGRRFPTGERGCGCCSALSAAAVGCDGRLYYYY